jgi:RNA methyltransferase, TrmH family
MLAPITSRNHDVVKRLRKLGLRTYRDRSRTFLVEGLNLLQEAIDSGARLSELAYVDSRAEEVSFLRSRFADPVPAHEISEDLMAWVSDVVTAQGIVGVVDQVDTPYEDMTLAEATLLLVADQVRDPGNLGSLLRIADASGVDAFLMTEGCADPYNPKVVRSAAGSHFHVRMARGVALSRLADDSRGRMSLLGLEPRGDLDYLDVDMTAPLAVVVGNEAFGIVEEDRGLLDSTVCINMPGRADSLNVASAAAVVLFEAVRQRGRSPGGVKSVG